MKNDSDISRPSHPRSQLEAWANLKGEQVTTYHIWSTLFGIVP